MTNIPYGKRANAIIAEDHIYEQSEEIYFVEMDSELNVNEEYEKYYVFKNKDNLVQTLLEGEFKWI